MLVFIFIMAVEPPKYKPIALPRLNPLQALQIKISNVMKAFLTIIICICFVGLVAECDNLVVLVVSKLACALVMVICGKLMTRYIDEELNEQV